MPDEGMAVFVRHVAASREPDVGHHVRGAKRCPEALLKIAALIGSNGLLLDIDLFAAKYSESPSVRVIYAVAGKSFEIFIYHNFIGTGQAKQFTHLSVFSPEVLWQVQVPCLHSRLQTVP